MRKRILLLLMVALLALGGLSGCSTPDGGADGTPKPSNTPIPTVTPEPSETPEPEDSQEPEETVEPTPEASQIPEQAILAPGETPMLIDPLDKPTRPPVVVLYDDYVSTTMPVTFKYPKGWAVDQTSDTNVRFIEPDADAKLGYPAQLHVRMYSRGTKQTADDAKTQLQTELDSLKDLGWTDFVHNDIASAKFGTASGQYTYYRASYDGLPLRGRIIVFAHNNALYMVRITSTQEYYIDYEDVYRRVRSTWKFT